MRMNSNTFSKPMPIEAKRFFMSISKLSTGKKNRRFKGSVKSMSYPEATTLQSNGLMGG